MLIKLSVIWFLMQVSLAQEENHMWDLAVAVNNQVEFLSKNGSLIGSSTQQFSKLKALTFDGVRHTILVSDMDQQNDTIYSIQLTKQTDINPILRDLPDDVQGLAIDPISNILYWTDGVNRTINKISLNDSLHMSQVFLDFKDEKPHDIAIDNCRRYIYWTNSNMAKPTIERAALDGTDRKVIVEDDLFMPTGIAVDQVTRTIYWTDIREGIYYRIESIKHDGTDRQILFEGTHQKPFAIALDDTSVYWTDINNNALWKMDKKESDSPQQLRVFEEKPMGLVAKYFAFLKTKECVNYIDAVSAYNGTIKDYFQASSKENDIIQCLNNGVLSNNKCICLKGFSGLQCENSVCYNYCLHGSCHLSTSGYPMCHCPVGFMGKRCERNVCDAFCLNGGKCSLSKNQTLEPVCECLGNFMGARCEKVAGFTELCSLFCHGKDADVLTDQKNAFICRCQQGEFTVLENTENLTAYELISGDDRGASVLQHFQDPAFLILMACVFVMSLLTIILSTFVCRLQRRPRIKKRIIVNKNVTPLTYRPQQPTEQCEITIENCCNMNVCETPCFEPPQLRNFQGSKKDEKKTLLSNMENGDDLY